MKPEQDIKNNICFYLSLLRKRGILDFWLNHTTGQFDVKRKIYRTRNSPYDRNGVADICGIIKGGKALFIEVKSKTGKQSENQKKFQESCELYGAIYILARSIQDVQSKLLPSIEKIDPNLMVYC